MQTEFGQRSRGQLKVHEVFGISPVLREESYVDRGQLDAELERILDRTTHIAVRGPSKSGKSWLRQKVLEDPIVVQCRLGKPFADIYVDALSQLAISLVVRESRQGVFKATVTAKGEIGAALLSKVGLEGALGSERGTTVDQAPVGHDVDDLRFVAAIILASGRRLAIECRWARHLREADDRGTRRRRVRMRGVVPFPGAAFHVSIQDLGRYRGMDKVFCPDCVKMVDFDVIERAETFTVRGEEITVDARIPACRDCGEEIGTAGFGDATFTAVYNEYRKRHGLLMPEGIRGIRARYGLGQEAFAGLLGWGDVTLSRYENGSLQSESHDGTLRLAEDPRNVARLFERNGDRLSAEQRTTLQARLDALLGERSGVIAREEAAPYGDASARKLGEMMVFFAERPKVWRTKLNKLLFYADFLHAKRHGFAISGARYVRLQFGPVPDGFYTLQSELVADASIDEIPAETGDRTGTLFAARRPADWSIFSPDELETMDYVAGHFARWSATRIKDYSHEEPAWLETHDRETISLSYAQTLRLT